MIRDVDRYQEAFEQHGIKVVCPEVTQHLEGDHLIEALHGAVGVIAGDDVFDTYVLDRCPDLRAIAKWGVGVDGIDSDAARERGIVVTNTPGMFDDEVADVCIGYMVLLARELHRIDKAVREGRWYKPVGRSLAALTCGVVGLGNIGRQVGRRCTAMGMTVLGSDPDPESCAEAKRLGIDVLPLDDLLAASDVLSLNCPLNDSTRHLLDRGKFQLVRNGMLLVNTSRGGVIDEEALVDALETGRVSGAALDVFEQEPFDPSSPLAQFEQVILGSHNASNTVEASLRTHERALDNLLMSLDIISS
jgi:D-3-phosphoglycerate dehydrogenase